MQNKPTRKELKSSYSDRVFKLQVVSFFVPIQIPPVQLQNRPYDSGVLYVGFFFLGGKNIQTQSKKAAGTKCTKFCTLLFNNQEHLRVSLEGTDQHKGARIPVQSRSKARLQIRVVQSTIYSRGCKDSLLGEESIEITSLQPDRETFRDVEIDGLSEKIVRVVLGFTPEPGKKSNR